MLLFVDLVLPEWFLMFSRLSCLWILCGGPRMVEVCMERQKEPLCGDECDNLGVVLFCHPTFCLFSFLTNLLALVMASICCFHLREAWVEAFSSWLFPSYSGLEDFGGSFSFPTSCFLLFPRTWLGDFWILDLLSLFPNFLYYLYY